MALVPDDEQHRLQILAGMSGRNRGHAFEKELAGLISKIDWSDFEIPRHKSRNRVVGNPAVEIVGFIVNDLKLRKVDAVEGFWLGGLATSGAGDIIRMPSGNAVSRSKTDVLLRITGDGRQITKGVTVKNCGNRAPTNDQLFFTTASAFCDLLRRNGIPFSARAEEALKMFCGDKGYRPLDRGEVKSRVSDPERWFYEELPTEGKKDIEQSLSRYQADVTRILLQRAYTEDPIPPEYVMHITVRSDATDSCDLAIFSVDELVSYSCEFAGFHTKEYVIRKGRFKGDPAMHSAPRFGFVQFQRGGQRQHPTQLQFNLMAGYFNHLTG